MKRIHLFLFAIFCFSLLALAQTGAVKQANESYSKGQYKEAAQQYESILANEGEAPELYYNLGNAYYKTNEIGRSILNYERALRLYPTYDDALANLALAQLKVIDNVVPAPSFFIGRWIEYLIKLLSSNQWIYLSLGMFVLCLISSFIFIFGSSRLLRKYAFYIGSVLLIGSILTVVFSGIRKEQLVNHDNAIIMTGAITIKSSPDRSGTDLFQLHEGTKVQIKSSLGKWVEIKLGNGSIGWVEVVNIEKI